MCHILPTMFLRSRRSDSLADFNSHSHTGVTDRMFQCLYILSNFNSHSYAGVTVAQVSTIIMALFQFALQYRSDYKISTKNHTFA